MLTEARLINYAANIAMLFADRDAMAIIFNEAALFDRGSQTGKTGISKILAAAYTAGYDDALRDIQRVQQQTDLMLYGDAGHA